MLKKHGVKIMIIAGILLIAGYAGYQLSTVPWGQLNKDQETLNAMEMPDPTLPPFLFIESTPPPTEAREEQDNTQGVNSSSYERLVALSGDITKAEYIKTYEPSDVSYTKSFDESMENLVMTSALNESSFTEQLSEIPLADASQTYEEDPIVALGIVKVPRLGLSEYVLEGSSDKVLKYGIGHVEGTPIPNEAGNVCIAAHRTSNDAEPFKFLNEMVEGDEIQIQHWNKLYTYEVYEEVIVSKYDVWVMEPIEGVENSLTLITCDPFLYPGGNRPNRLVVRAKLVSVEDIES